MSNIIRIERIDNGYLVEFSTYRTAYLSLEDMFKGLCNYYRGYSVGRSVVIKEETKPEEKFKTKHCPYCNVEVEYPAQTCPYCRYNYD